MPQPSKLPRFCAILMASGFSHRFGAENKLLARFRGQPLAAHTLATVCGCGAFNSVYFVCAEPAVAALAWDYPVHLLHNSAPEHGQSESIRLGVAAAEADFYVFFPCDQPLLRGETLAALLKAAKPGRITVPILHGRQTTPAVFSGSFRAQLLALAPGQNARSIKQAYPNLVDAIAVPYPESLADADTPEALLALEHAGTPI